MRYLALATDYDGTLAEGGAVAEKTWEALRRVRASGRKLILVTGRELDDLLSVCPGIDNFDRVVAENGGLLYRPDTRAHRVLGPPPPPELVQALRDCGVSHLGLGHTIVATVEPYDTIVLDVIRTLGLELQVIFNKGAVMVLPPGVNKASGLAAALEELGLSLHNVVGVGDAENDHAFLGVCECSAAVANALPRIKEHADIVLASDHGPGVVELIEALLADDLASQHGRLCRHDVLLGRRDDGSEIGLPAYGTVLLVAGPSASGKSTATTGLLERLGEAGYQFCVLDPEGDYQEVGGAIVVGAPGHSPAIDEVVQLLRQPRQNVIVNLLGIALADRPLFCAGLLGRVQEVRVQTGRPHWMVFDEAHHLYPSTWQPASAALPLNLETGLLITVHPEEVSPAILGQVNTAVAVGAGGLDTLTAFAQAAGRSPPRGQAPELSPGRVLLWQRQDETPFLVEVERGHAEHRRHTRKYAEGRLSDERSFYFKGPQGKLNLRAHNLILFLELAQGVDEETWLYHLRQGDYSGWFRKLGDKDLAALAEAVEADHSLSAAQSREKIAEAVGHHYTLPARSSEPSGVVSKVPE